MHDQFYTSQTSQLSSSLSFSLLSPMPSRHIGNILFIHFIAQIDYYICAWIIWKVAHSKLPDKRVSKTSETSPSISKGRLWYGWKPISLSRLIISENVSVIRAYLTELDWTEVYWHLNWSASMYTGCISDAVWCVTLVISRHQTNVLYLLLDSAGIISQDLVDCCNYYYYTNLLASFPRQPG